jgi:hypothetical protein
MVTETASHSLCECVVVAEFRVRRFGKRFMEPRDYYTNLFCQMYETTARINQTGKQNKSEIGRGARVAL